MRRTMLFLVVAIAVAFVASGCTSPFRWQATEGQKQAADLTVRDLEALALAVPTLAAPILREAKQCAKITQEYVGLPKTRLETVAEANPYILEQAEADAVVPPPDFGDIADATYNRLDLILAIGATVVAGVGGVGGVKLKTSIAALRTKLATAKTAVDEIVTGIEGLDVDTKATVKAKQEQSPATEALVLNAKQAEKVE